MSQLMTSAEKGFILSRHWRDTRQGVEVTYWLLTDTRPQKITIPYQKAIGFLPESKLSIVKPLLDSQPNVTYRRVELYRFSTGKSVCHLLSSIPPITKSQQKLQ